MAVERVVIKNSDFLEPVAMVMNREVALDEATCGVLVSQYTQHTYLWCHGWNTHTMLDMLDIVMGY